ncbi:RNA polymerase sigma-70 factor [Sphingobacterium sp. SGG-5]|uniref:RNA polymerase sigma-70 factor n=1 Tax=Sphingobacterium sp. SGG-5 TaxID=2710881 RepID=UPI0013EB5D46|nr:RNA polymerase sigma-70 factor [Sphingobacterium sp. SGG-5]NGM63354.1 RNA polymerase sigma-70 factor [Sphingobacterium sp. SGG-5]
MLINEETFTQAYNDCWEKVFCICHKHVGDMEIAKELVQDIFKSVWERRETLYIDTCIERYLLRCAKLKVFEYIRNKQIRSEHLKYITEVQEKDSNITEDTIMHNALSETLDGLVATLPLKCQNVFRLSREKGLTNKEIAYHLIISERTVEHHLSNALKLLKSKLKKQKIYLQ